MDDPYKILGISTAATDEEITKAYRRLAKKYHPDINPGNEEAGKKMQEVNAAYEQIKKNQHGGATYERSDGTYGPQEQGGYGSPYGDYDPFSGFWEFFGGGYSEHGGANQDMFYVQSAINMGQYHQALSYLSRISEKDGQWHFYSAIANAGTGGRVTALNHAKEACRLEPDNEEYKQLLSNFEKGSFQYQRARQAQGYGMTNIGSLLIPICATQMLLNCCCRPF